MQLFVAQCQPVEIVGNVLRQVDKTNPENGGVVVIGCAQLVERRQNKVFFAEQPEQRIVLAGRRLGFCPAAQVAVYAGELFASGGADFGLFVLTPAARFGSPGGIFRRIRTPISR